MKIKLLIAGALATIFSFTSCEAQKNKNNSGGQVSLKTTADSVSYAIGTSIGENLKRDGLDSINVDIMAEGIRTMMRGDSAKINQMEAQRIIGDYVQNMQTKKGEALMESGKKFLEENKKQQGVIILPSGLQYMVIKEGTGPKPSETDTVVTHYHGTLVDGTVFDSSVDRGEPVSFPVGGVIRGWTEALLLMNEGSKWRLFIPSDLAYGDRGAGGVIGPNATLIFDVELIEVKGK